MPTYSYRCTECGNAFDIVQAFTDDSLTVCPTCGGVLRKVFSPIGVSFSGSGFYRTDSRTEAGAKAGRKDSGGKSEASSAGGGSSAKGESAGKSGTSDSGAKKDSGGKSESSSTGGSGGSAGGGSGSGSSAS